MNLVAEFDWTEQFNWKSRREEDGKNAGNVSWVKEKKVFINSNYNVQQVLLSPGPGGTRVQDFSTISTSQPFPTQSDIKYGQYGGNEGCGLQNLPGFPKRSLIQPFTLIHSPVGDCRPSPLGAVGVQCLAQRHFRSQSLKCQPLYYQFTACSTNWGETSDLQQLVNDTVTPMLASCSEELSDSSIIFFF